MAAETLEGAWEAGDAGSVLGGGAAIFWPLRLGANVGASADRHAIGTYVRRR